ncbi:demethoxyubiquinone hydroxylase family protein [Halopseudomonas pelagia]|uniref:Ferritin Dps family protein n=1 Tax=Halopseudomonas pelagia TaxID=553151 RepID=A0AA91Z6M0_9GAMM|nr:ferritin-like domain-containing protein [Halopseudomonas pelagia]PCC99859.1 ferritin Dps family protein [Halopseudomonas pelagia]QFY56280.1 ferritin-like domain-containing protein [Halopseudomonas pelagia]
MEKAAELGHNVTGAQMSPEDTKSLLQAVEKYPPDIKGDASRLALARTEMRKESGPVGSVPIPGSVKGVLKSGFDKMLGKQPELLVDKLGERLAYERTGVRLYEAALAKFEGTATDDKELIPTLRRIRDDEAAHMKIVKEAIETLGADPTAMTPCADVAGVMAQGIMQVLTDPRTNVSQALNALLTLELTDNAAWELLVDLTSKAGHPKIAASFEKALAEEERHVSTIKALLQQQLAAQA